MRPKPKGLSPEYGAQFGDAAIVAAYPSRPPYTEGVFSTLTDLIGNGPRTASISAVGRAIRAAAGSVGGARRCRRFLRRHDCARQTPPGGDVSNLRWIAGAAEDAPLAPPYGLVTAGESLHWMAWDVVLPRLRESLTPGGMLAVVERGEAPSLWWDDLIALIARYSTNRDFQPYDVIDAATERGLFAEKGRLTLTRSRTTRVSSTTSSRSIRATASARPHARRRCRRLRRCRPHAALTLRPRRHATPRRDGGCGLGRARAAFKTTVVNRDRLHRDAKWGKQATRSLSCAKKPRLFHSSRSNSRAFVLSQAKSPPSAPPDCRCNLDIQLVVADGAEAIEVGRADGRPLAIDGAGLGVDHRRDSRRRGYRPAEPVKYPRATQSVMTLV